MAIQLKGGGGNSRNRNNSMGQPEIQETPEMKEARLKREAEAKAAVAQKQEEMRMRALAFEQRDAARREREELKNNPELAAERQRKLQEAREEEEKFAKMKAEEEAKIEAERRVQEKKMDQTEALIAAIRAQVEKEKAAKAAANQKQEAAKSTSSKPSSNAGSKPQFRTISPEELEKMQERKRMKAEGIQPKEESTPVGASGGVSGGLGGLGGGPTLSNPSGGGPTLSNPNAGQESLTSVGSMGNSGLGIDITAAADKKDSADESTVALDVQAINSAAEPKTNKPHEPAPITGESSTIVVNDDSTWNAGGGSEKTEEELNWVESETPKATAKVETKTTNAEGDIVSVIPVRQRPADANDVHSAYNIDFDDDDDDDDIMGVGGASSAQAEEEARRKAEEEAKRKAEEEARRKAEEEAKRRAEEEARKAQEEARRKAEEEAKRKAEEEARRKAEEEAKRRAEEEARRKAEEEAKRRAEEEARRKAEEEAKRRAEEEARRKAEEEAKRRAEEEARKAAEEEARRRAEEEARRKAEEEARRAVEEEARRKAEEEARRVAEEEARRRAEEEARRAVEEEARRKAEEETRRAAEEEARRKAEEEARKAAESQSATGSSTDYGLPVGAEQFLGKYLTVSAISDQIVKAIKYISENPSSPRNVVILGQYGFGTTTIAEDFARSFHAMGICKNKTIAKIKGGALNRANISDAISKLQGGCLVVENAGVITKEKLDEIYQIVSNPSNDVVVILTGQIETLSRIFKDNVVISSQFKHLIQVHRITDLDVLAIAKNHARISGYPCEAGAENNLRRRMQEVESGNLDRVLKIVDNAVSKAHNREMSTGEQEHHLLPSDFE
jgi:hypothetical protein